MAERRKNRRDQDLRDAVSLLQSARGKPGLTRFMPADRDMQKTLGDELVEWSKKDDSDDIDDFFFDKQIGPMKFYGACEDNAYLAECLDLALATLGRRIKQKVKESHDYNMRVLPHYSSLARKERKEKLDSDKGNAASGIVTLGIPTFVAEKKKK